MKQLSAWLVILSFLAAVAHASDVHIAAAGNDIEKLKFILKEKPERVNEQNEEGIWPLLCVLMEDDHEKPGDPAKLLAERTLRLKTIKFLLEQKADPNFKEKRSGGFALQCAAHTGFLEAASLLLKFGADPNAQDIEGRAAICNAIETGQMEMLEFLIEKGAKVNYSANVTSGAQPKKTTLIHMFAGNSIHFPSSTAFPNNTAILKFLLNHGADPTLKDSDGQTALDVAEKCGNRRIAVALAILNHKRKSILGKWVVNADTDTFFKRILDSRPEAAKKMTDDEKNRIKELGHAITRSETHEFLEGGRYVYDFKISKELLKEWLALIEGDELEEEKKRMRVEFEGFTAKLPIHAEGKWSEVDGELTVNITIQEVASECKLLTEKGALKVHGFMSRLDFTLVPSE